MNSTVHCSLKSLSLKTSPTIGRVDRIYIPRTREGIRSLWLPGPACRSTGGHTPQRPPPTCLLPHLLLTHCLPYSWPSSKLGPFKFLTLTHLFPTAGPGYLLFLSTNILPGIFRDLVLSHSPTFRSAITCWDKPSLNTLYKMALIHQSLSIPLPRTLSSQQLWQSIIFLLVYFFTVYCLVPFTRR